MEQTHNTYTGEKTHWPCWKIQSELSLMPLFPWGRCIQSFPVAVITFTRPLAEATQQHRGKTVGKGGASFTWVLTPILEAWWCWFIPGCSWPWVADSVNDNWKLVCLWKVLFFSRDSFSKQMNFCYLQPCVLKWTSIHFSLLKPGPPAESVRRAPYTCQTPNAGQ